MKKKTEPDWLRERSLWKSFRVFVRRIFLTEVILDKIDGVKQKSNDVRMYEKFWEYGNVFDSHFLINAEI